DDAMLVRRSIARDPWAAAQLVDRYGPYLQRVLARLLGSDPELGDLLQETFSRVFSRLDRLRDPSTLKTWMTSIAVFTARETLRRRRRARWLHFFAPGDLPDAPDAWPGADAD